MALKLFTYIEQNPIIDTKKTQEALGISYNACASAIKILCELGILEKYKGYLRNKIFAYTTYINILKNETDYFYPTIIPLILYE